MSKFNLLLPRIQSKSDPKLQDQGQPGDTGAFSLTTVRVVLYSSMSVVHVPRSWLAGLQTRRDDEHVQRAKRLKSLIEAHKHFEDLDSKRGEPMVMMGGISSQGFKSVKDAHTQTPSHDAEPAIVGAAAPPESCSCEPRSWEEVYSESALCYTLRMEDYQDKWGEEAETTQAITEQVEPTVVDSETLETLLE